MKEDESMDEIFEFFVKLGKGRITRTGMKKFVEEHSDNFKNKTKLKDLLYDLTEEVMIEKADYPDDPRIPEDNSEEGKDRRMTHLMKMQEFNKLGRFLHETIDLLNEDSEKTTGSSVPVIPVETTEIDEKKNNIQIPENPYPTIFKDGCAYQMFLELKALTVKDNSIVADYGFIFHQMKKKTIQAINSIVTEPAFIKFLNTNFQTDISVVKLPYKDPEYKQKPYSIILGKYNDCFLAQPQKGSIPNP
jgi:hypothetical protein